MDKFEILLYVLISLGWFLFQSSRKKKQKGTIKPPRRTIQEQLPTLEEQEKMLEPERRLLEELLGKVPETEVREEPAFQFEAVHEEEEPLEELEKAVKERKKKKFERFEGYRLRAKMLQEEDEEQSLPYILDDLVEDPNGARKAIIYAEILNRKYD